MIYRVCKSFEVESGHMLSKHPGLCRYPHGHTRRIDVILAATQLDERDMVCDFKVLRLALRDHLARLDHSMAMNKADPMVKALEPMRDRLVLFEADPTTEVFAKSIFEFLRSEIAQNKTYHDDRGDPYRFPATVRLERVRVTETSSSWAEVEAD